MDIITTTPSVVAQAVTVTAVEEEKYTPPPHYAQLEDYLYYAEEATTLASRIVGFAKSVGEIFNWNANQGGLPEGWEKEENLKYKIWLVGRLTAAMYQILPNLETVCGVPHTAPQKASQPQAEDATKPATADDTNSQKLLSKREISELALTPFTLKRKLDTTEQGSTDSAKAEAEQTFTVAGTPKAIEFVHLLKKNTGLTLDQLRFIANWEGDPPFSRYNARETEKAVRLLTSAKFISETKVLGWRGRVTKLYRLTPNGETYYTLLVRDPGTKRPEPQSSLPHLYGTNQVLASIAGACAVATSEGRLTNLHKELNQGKLPPQYGPAEQIAMRLEWESANFILPYNQTQFVYPDAVGRLVLDERSLNKPLIQQAGLAWENSDIRYVISKFEGVGVWPFMLEYDTTEEELGVIAGKASAYTELYNAPITYWPEQWLGRFPVILVVTSGRPERVLNMANAVRIRLKKVAPNLKKPEEWLFTSVEWFKQAYGPYLNTINFSKVGQASQAQARQLAARLKGHIWLPLTAIPMTDKESNQAPLRSLSRGRGKGGKAKPGLAELLALNAKAGVNTPSVTASQINWLDKLVALPIPH